MHLHIGIGQRDMVENLFYLRKIKKENRYIFTMSWQFESINTIYRFIFAAVTKKPNTFTVWLNSAFEK